MNEYYKWLKIGFQKKTGLKQNYSVSTMLNILKLNSMDNTDINNLIHSYYTI